VAHPEKKGRFYSTQRAISDSFSQAVDCTRMTTKPVPR